MIRLNDISIVLRHQRPSSEPILTSVTLTIARGDWIALTGPNGSGKTTLLKTLAGLLPPAAGSISYDNGSAEPPRFSLLLQDPDNQFVASSVRNELLLSAAAGSARGSGRDPDRNRVERRVTDAAGRFSLEGYLDRNPHELSGGEKQRLALATVWLEQPDVLLLDEPVSFLDAQSRSLCIGFVREMNRRGTAVVWATPGGDELLAAERVVFLAGGTIAFSGTWQEYLRYAALTGGDCPLPCLFEFAGMLADTLRGGGPAEETRRDRPVHENDPGNARNTIAFSNVSASYRQGEPVLHSLTLSVEAGECLGIAGPNGSGKTTLLEIAGGVHRPRSGSVRFNTTDETTPDRLIDCFYLLQSPEQMFFAESVRDELAFGLRRAGIGPEERVALISAALAAVELDPGRIMPRSPFTLSFGEMRRAALAIAVSLRPAVLLLDEPSACLDRAGKAVLQSVIARWRDEGRTVLLASHDIDFLAETCNRLLFIEQGSIAGETRLEREVVSAGSSWPGTEKPLVLDLQERTRENGAPDAPLAITRGAYIRRLLADADGDGSSRDLPE